MKFNSYSNLRNQHAFLSASKYHWINYDEEKLLATYNKHIASIMGTRLHEYACESIKLGIKLPRNNKTLNAYVNDAIGFGMTPEQTLYYSDNCFGTADAISFNKGLLRVHDLKTGSSISSTKQVEVYASIFCLEYSINPEEIDIELRIYQNDEVLIHKPEPELIRDIMNKIIVFDKLIDKMKMG